MTQAVPYKLKLSLVESRLVFSVARENDAPVITHILSLTPFRRVIKDYFMICESYYEAIRTSTPSQIEAIDMGRRGIHNEGSETLRERLGGKIDVDFDTARRLFNPDLRSALAGLSHDRRDDQTAQIHTVPVRDEFHPLAHGRSHCPCPPAS